MTKAPALVAAVSAILAAALAAGQGCSARTESPAPKQRPAHSQHTVTVKFDYDFGLTPACTKKHNTGCVQQFVIYDISAGVNHGTKLFVIPLPSHPKGAVKGITATSLRLDFESGKHLIAAVAQEPDGTESPHPACTTWITIP